MKKISFFTIIALFTTLMITSCTKKVDENGLTRQIRKIVPDSILTNMMNQGMPINGGNEPPEIEGTYIATPFDMISSSVPDDPETHQFADFIVTFKNFNKRKLTLEIDYENGPETGTGLASFVVGEGNKFSMFCEVKSTQLILFKADAILVITGTLTENGIEDFYVANFMVDNHGNTVPLGIIDEDLGVWIPNGTGRVIYDSDGFSEQTGGSKSNPLNNNKSSWLTITDN